LDGKTVLPLESGILLILEKKRRADFLVIRVVQGWGPPVRTAELSEILLLRFNFK
jgi:hypothetical protein